MKLNLNNAKIYKIIAPNSNNIYIGSTTGNLKVRLRAHLSSYKRFLNGKSKNYCSSFEILKCFGFKIVPIEFLVCSSRKELLGREGYYINKFSNICVNKIISGRTKKESQYAYIKKLIGTNKYENFINKKKIAVKKYHAKNKTKINEAQRIRALSKYTCICGMTLCKGAKYLHVRNSIHKSNLAKLLNIPYLNVNIKKPKSYLKSCQYFNIGN